MELEYSAICGDGILCLKMLDKRKGVLRKIHEFQTCVFSAAENLTSY